MQAFIIGSGVWGFSWILNLFNLLAGCMLVVTLIVQPSDATVWDILLMLVTTIFYIVFSIIIAYLGWLMLKHSIRLWSASKGFHYYRRLSIKDQNLCTLLMIPGAIVCLILLPLALIFVYLSYSTGNNFINSLRS